MRFFLLIAAGASTGSAHDCLLSVRVTRNTMLLSASHVTTAKQYQKARLRSERLSESRLSRNLTTKGSVRGCQCHCRLACCGVTWFLCLHSNTTVLVTVMPHLFQTNLVCSSQGFPWTGMGRGFSHFVSTAFYCFSRPANFWAEDRRQRPRLATLPLHL